MEYTMNNGFAELSSNEMNETNGGGIGDTVKSVASDCFNAGRQFVRSAKKFIGNLFD
jgi:hypothetical protein